VVVATAVASTAACSSERSATKADDGAKAGGLIGISMPTRSLERWNKDGDHLQNLLRKAGYTTSLQYADDKVDSQITQIQNMINQDAKVLVITAINDESLTPVLQAAVSKGIKVVAYDRPIMGTPNVDYYATFDNYKVGQLQGQFIVEKLGLDSASGPFTLEPFAGDAADNNAKHFFAGAWDVLLPYVKSGKLVVPSGKKPVTNAQWKKVSIEGWSSQKAQAEMDNRLNSYYTGGKKLDVILSPNDSLALGIAQSLTSHGFKPGGNWPILTGQDGDLANTKNIIAGKQSMTVWKDTRLLGDVVSAMVDQIVTGKTVTVNDTQTYNNGVKVVPTNILQPVVVTKENIKEKMVGSGFRSAAELGL
jgi:putative multiple sugar transport system substrate-binding protein